VFERLLRLSVSSIAIIPVPLMLGSLQLTGPIV